MLPKFYKCNKCEIISHDLMCINSRVLANGCIHNWDIYIIEEKNKNSIKLEYAENPTFDMVTINGFFINIKGFLCQKHSEVTYVVIADKGGNSMTDYCVVSKKSDIKIILPKTIKIEF